MTLRLIAIRHAKSSWDDPLLEDHARVLKSRGREAAPRIGAWLRQKDYLPEQAFVSSAMRTRETWALLGLPGTVDVTDRLYHAAPDVILESLRLAQGRTVAVVGHNPGLAHFARTILQAPPRDAEFDRFPTCATLIADFEAERWEEVRFGQGRLVDFIVPRRLG